MSRMEVVKELEDRRGWLRFFGGVFVLLGMLLLLGGSAIVVDLVQEDPEEWPLGLALLSGGIVAVPGALLLWLGVGSMRCRRWGRALIRLFSGLALALMAYMILGLVTMLASGSGMLEPGEESGLLLGAAIPLVVLGIPLFVVYRFYGSPSVVATVERRDPVWRWTDKRPLPVLGMSLVHLLGLLAGVAMLVLDVFGSLAPGGISMPTFFFGALLTGGVATLYWVVVTALYALFTWRFFQVRLSGLKGMIGILLLYLASGLVTQMTDPYGRAMEQMWGEGAAEVMRDMPPEMMTSASMGSLLMTLLYTLPWLAAYWWMYRRIFLPLREEAGPPAA
ncbi:MAG: hypothetical protein AB7D51_07975 [Desulfovibrionaceae bacterium]